MGHHRCLTCDLKTGRPELHSICQGKLPQWEICTCGSGGHPRWCDLHPENYAAHVKDLNDVNELENYSDRVIEYFQNSITPNYVLIQKVKDICETFYKKKTTIETARKQLREICDLPEEE